jgi:hypothetical protein
MRQSNFILIVTFAFVSGRMLCQQSTSLGETARQLRTNGNTASQMQPALFRTQTLGSDSTMVLGVDNAAKAAQGQADQYFVEVQELLHRGNFDALDELAATARSSKDRFGGGGWKLHTVYLALTKPSEALAKEDSAWEAMIAKLTEWKSQKAESITAQVALAGAYVNYAWKARGSGSADKVGDEQWRLFEDRLELARTTLTEAATLHQKCPEWYWQMQAVALGQAWDRDLVIDLFHRAVSFEPDYQYYYRAMARYLSPEWHGSEGDLAAFADKVYAEVGDKQGSILYFEIAAEFICGCGKEPALRILSWQKIRLGYSELEQVYGPSALKLNQFAYLAVQNRDRDSAHESFRRIGDNWSDVTWLNKKYFDRSKAWASPMNDNLQIASAKVDSNMLTANGRIYDGQIAREFPEKLSDVMKGCLAQNSNDISSFNLFVLVGGDGATLRILHQPATSISTCLLPKLTSVIFSPPPQPEYWVKVSMNFQP